ncbi:hypothetical protein [Paracoccus sp. DMF]|uniref:hypothetical protein n=1 Tax=Paracoccus sp. DMF TaxID=400837 RepID=UPI0011006FB7|nr:hypothetical protein [Paracoccus sp. DMF]MCV2446553.1 hypothetical protein [Paracoccus sp. DMF]
MPKDVIPPEINFETEAARTLYQGLCDTWSKRFAAPPPQPYGFMNFRDDDHARQVGAVLLPDKPHVHAANVLRRHLRWLPHGAAGADGWLWRYESYETTACELDLVSPAAKNPREAGIQAVKAATNSLVKAGVLKRDLRAPTGRSAVDKVNHYRLTEPAFCAVLSLLWWSQDHNFETRTMDARTFRRVWTEMRYPTDSQAKTVRDVLAGWQAITSEDDVASRMDAVMELAAPLLPKHWPKG